jgi:hypothetical protein
MNAKSRRCVVNDARIVCVPCAEMGTCAPCGLGEARCSPGQEAGFLFCFGVGRRGRALDGAGRWRARSRRAGGRRTRWTGEVAARGREENALAGSRNGLQERAEGLTRRGRGVRERVDGSDRAAQRLARASRGVGEVRSRRDRARLRGWTGEVAARPSESTRSVVHVARGAAAMTSPPAALADRCRSTDGSRRHHSPEA